MVIKFAICFSCVRLSVRLFAVCLVCTRARVWYILSLGSLFPCLVIIVINVPSLGLLVQLGRRWSPRATAVASVVMFHLLCARVNHSSIFHSVVSSILSLNLSSFFGGHPLGASPRFSSSYCSTLTLGVEVRVGVSLGGIICGGLVGVLGMWS